MQQENKNTFKTITILVVAALMLFIIMTLTKKEVTTPVVGGEQTIMGTTTCLPHHDTTGPTTMECAFGLKAESGEYYALDTQDLAAVSVAAAQTTESPVIVTGDVTPIEALSTDQWQKYNIVGVIRVSSIGLVDGKEAAVDVSGLLGKWIGVEGTTLMVSKTTTESDGDRYILDFVMLDGPVSVQGVSVSDGIQFSRDGETFTLHPGSGEDTGMKYLVDKKDCVVVQSYEGYCRD